MHKEKPGEREDSRRTGGSRVDTREVDKGDGAAWIHKVELGRQDGAGYTKWNWVDRMELDTESGTG